jgi:hypothetical protein
MESDSSSRPSEESAIYPYPEPDQSSPRPPNDFLKIRFNTILPCTPMFPKWYLSLDGRNGKNSSIGKDLLLVLWNFRQNGGMNFGHKRLRIIGYLYEALTNNAIPTETLPNKHDIWYEGNETTWFR